VARGAGAIRLVVALEVLMLEPEVGSPHAEVPCVYLARQPTEMRLPTFGAHAQQEQERRLP
jgi:hypothetical protein